jgi:tetratricopeptide (TPR) repeat protein
MERYQDTVAELNRAIEQNPEDTGAIAQRGEMYRQMEHFEAALADFDRAIELNPNYAWAIAHRGETYYQMKRYEEALDDFNRAIEVNPDYIWAIAHRGAIYRFMGKPYYEKAVADFTQAIDLKPDYAWAIAYRCQTYGLMNRYQEALVDFDRAIVLDKTIIPNWPGERGLLLSYLGQYAEAIACCEQGLQENPADYVTLYTLAVVKARWKGLVDAQAEIEKTRSALQTVMNRSTCAGGLYRIGGLAALEGDRDRALNCLQEAISLENEPLELARRDLAWLDLRDDPRFQSLISQNTEVLSTQIKTG